MSFFLIPKQNKFLVQTKFQPHKSYRTGRNSSQAETMSVRPNTSHIPSGNSEHTKERETIGKWANSCYKNAYSTCLFFISKPSMNFNCDFNFIIISWGSMRKNVRDYSVTKSLVSSKVRNIYPTYNFKKKSKVLILLYHLRRFFFIKKSLRYWKCSSFILPY